jgi:hypothetical protein
MYQIGYSWWRNTRDRILYVLLFEGGSDESNLYGDHLTSLQLLTSQRAIIIPSKIPCFQARTGLTQFGS